LVKNSVFPNKNSAQVGGGKHLPGPNGGQTKKVLNRRKMKRGRHSLPGFKRRGIGEGESKTNVTNIDCEERKTSGKLHAFTAFCKLSIAAKEKKGRRQD